MPKKKITVGLSSKNGKKALNEKYVYCELTREQVLELEKKHEEIEIDFPPTKFGGFMETALEIGAILGGNSPLFESIQNERQEELFENIKKLYLLLDHYGIDPNDPQRFMLLSIELARELFPTSPTRGRSKKWTPEIEAILVVEMERKISNGKNESDAARALSRDKYWSDFVETKSSPDTKENKTETLRNKYSKIKNRKNIKLLRQEFDPMDQSQLESRKRTLMRKYIDI